MHDNLFFERFVKELKVSVGPAFIPVNVHAVDATKIVRVVTANCETVRVIMDIMPDSFKLLFIEYYAVVKAILEGIEIFDFLNIFAFGM